MAPLNQTLGYVLASHVSFIFSYFRALKTAAGSDNAKNNKGTKRKTADNEPTTSSSLLEENEDMLSSIKRRRSAAPLPAKKRGSKAKEKKGKGSRKRETQFTK